MNLSQRRYALSVLVPMAKITNALASEQKTKRPFKSGVKFTRGTNTKCANVQQKRRTILERAVLTQLLCSQDQLQKLKMKMQILPTPLAAVIPDLW